MNKNFKNKVCELCSVVFTPDGPAARYCTSCGPAQRKQVQRAGVDRYREKKGVLVGIGSGNAQGIGTAHHGWKNGISRFIEFSLQARQTVRYCERCHKDLLNAQRGEWATHHRDHNRDNNVRENWELLCKRCHQIEHACWLNFNRKPTAA